MVLINIVTGLVLFSVIFWLVDRHDRIDRLNKAIDREQGAISLFTGELEQRILLIKHDVSILSEVPAIFDFLKQRTREKEVEELFLALARARSDFDQVRLLDLNGDELIRVNIQMGKSLVVPRDQLQNKFDRDYFTALLNSSDRSVKILGLDLNIEHKKIEIPYKPMIRAGRLLRDSNGNKLGVLVLNFYANRLIEFVKERQKLFHGQLLLAFNSGHWILPPPGHGAWGNQVAENQNDRFQKLFPGVWENLSDDHRDYVKDDQATFLSRTINWNGHSFRIISYIKNDGIVVGPHDHTYLYLLGCLATIGLGVAIAYLRHRRDILRHSLQKSKRHLMQVKRLESISHLSAGIAHELNSPITALDGFINYLKDGSHKIPGISAEEMTFCLTECSKAMKKIKMIISRVKLFSEYERDKVANAVLLDGLLVEFLYEKAFKLNDRSIRLHNQINNENIFLEIAKDDLFLVLNELINNAIESLDKKDGSRIIIVDVSVDNHFCNILIKDNGSGIDQESIDKIFDPFYTTKQIGHNRGLGLSVSYGIIKKYFGTILAKNSENGGAEFLISLPLAMSKEAAA